MALGKKKYVETKSIKDLNDTESSSKYAARRNKNVSASSAQVVPNNVINPANIQQQGNSEVTNNVNNVNNMVTPNNVSAAKSKTQTQKKSKQEKARIKKEKNEKRRQEKARKKNKKNKSNKNNKNIEIPRSNSGVPDGQVADMYFANQTLLENQTSAANQVSGTGQVPAGNQVPAGSQAFAGQVPAESQVPVENQIPAGSQTFVENQIPAGSQTPAVSQTFANASSSTFVNSPQPMPEETVQPVNQQFDNVNQTEINNQQSNINQPETSGLEQAKQIIDNLNKKKAEQSILDAGNIQNASNSMSNPNIRNNQNGNFDVMKSGDQGLSAISTGIPETRSAQPSGIEKRKKRRRRKKVRNLLIVITVVVLSILVGFGIYLYSSGSFKIENVKINGVEHLTEDEILQLAAIPDDATLLNVDMDTIKQRLRLDAWIKDVDVVRQFPDTLVLNVKERSITAIVEVPTSVATGVSTSQSSSTLNSETTVRHWAISSDHMWLMPIPEKNSEAAKNINQQIYADVEGVMHIVDISPSVQPEIGAYCTDENVNCAIDVVASMTTELKNQVKYVKAADPFSTTLVLDNGVEIAVGTNDDMREKERICLDLLKKYEGKITYINVRSISNPTWRTI